MTKSPQPVSVRGLIITLVAALALAAFPLLATSAFPNADPAQPTTAKKKKQKKITGKLTKRAYTVIALAKNGEAKTKRAPKGKFKLRPPAKKVTLHLRAPDGTYAGPIVLAKQKKGKRAILGVKAKKKVNLGKVKVRASKGYAKAKPKKKFLDKKRKARAKKGVPIGAGSFGLVRSKKTHGGAPGDLDLDGIPDPLDIDDDGDKVLDNFDRKPRKARAIRASAIAQTSSVGTVYMRVIAINEDGSVTAKNDCLEENAPLTGTFPEGSPAPIVGKTYKVKFDLSDLTILSVTGPIAGGCPLVSPTLSSALTLTLKETVNANAAGLTVADTNDTVARRGFLLLSSVSKSGVTVELDCGGTPDPDSPSGWSGGLSYCAKGGTGRWSPEPIPTTPPRSWPLAFPDCCDSDGDGFGEPPRVAVGAPFFSPGATTDQIGSGDLLNWRLTQDGAETEFSTSLLAVFATVPALVSWNDGAGNSGTVNYPVPPPYVGSPPDWMGGDQGPYEGFEVAPCPAGAPAPCVEGDYVLTFSFWRPQREAIPGAEQGQWTDIGGLAYSAGIGPLGACQQSDYSTADPNLTADPGSGFNGGGGFRDSAADRPADPANTLSFSLNLSKCAMRHFGNTTTPPGFSVEVFLFAAPGGGGLYDFGALAAQELYFTLE